MQINGRELRLIDGAPDISRLPCDRLVASDGIEYMRRYYTHSPRGKEARFHQILTDDPQLDLHDHPWDFVSYLLTGSYVEYTPDGAVEYKAPCIIPRKAEQLHRLVLPEGPVWTYVVLGRIRRDWGFMTDNGWVYWADYSDTGDVVRCKSAPMHRRKRSKSPPKW